MRAWERAPGDQPRQGGRLKKGLPSVLSATLATTEGQTARAGWPESRFSGPCRPITGFPAHGPLPPPRGRQGAAPQRLAPISWAVHSQGCDRRASASSFGTFRRRCERLKRGGLQRPATTKPGTKSSHRHPALNGDLQSRPPVIQPQRMEPRPGPGRLAAFPARRRSLGPTCDGQSRRLIGRQAAP